MTPPIPVHAPHTLPSTEPSPPLSSPSSTTSDAQLCKVCFDAQLNAVLEPCHHLCVCAPCAALMT